MTTLHASPALPQRPKWILLGGAVLALVVALVLIVPSLAAVAQPGVIRLNASGLSFPKRKSADKPDNPLRWNSSTPTAIPMRLTLTLSMFT